MTTPDTNEFMRQLDQDPDLLEEVRARILTREPLLLPETVAQLVGAQQETAGQPGNSKERTFESTFVLALRQPRRRSSSPARTRTDSERKTPKVQNDGTTAVQKTLPITGVAEREAASPQLTKPIAIRPRRHARRRVSKNLQRSFLPDPPPDPSESQ